MRNYACTIPLTAAHEFQYGGVRSTELLKVTQGEQTNYGAHAGFYATSVNPSITLTIAVSKSSSPLVHLSLHGS